MSEEEPAWRAELEEDLRLADLEDEDLWPVIAKHIQAAEQRGREAALREAAAKIRDHWFPRVPGAPQYTQGKDAGLDLAADLIDPDKP